MTVFVIFVPFCGKLFELFHDGMRRVDPKSCLGHEDNLVAEFRRRLEMYGDRMMVEPDIFRDIVDV